MLGILVDVHEETMKLVEVEDELEEFYRLLRCDCIDIVVREIEGVPYDIVCDDEGLLKDGFIVSAIDERGLPQLVGSLLFLHHDNEGNMVGIDPNELSDFVKRIGIYSGRRVVVLDKWR